MSARFLPKMRLLTPGPTPIPEEIRLALAQDMVHHRKPPFKELMARVQVGLKILFGTEQPVLPLSCSGSGAMAAAVDNLFAPGEKVLVVEGGKFGERWTELAAHRGLSAHVLKVEWGKAVDPDEVDAALANDPAIRGVLVQVSETSTGVLHPVRELGEVCAARGVLLVADGISAVGVSPCPMDEWRIDCLLTGSQKGLMLPPGLALCALSARAWKKAESVTPGCYYFDLKAEREQCLKNQTRFTSPIGLLLGLDACLSMLLTAGLEDLYRRQWAMTRMTREGASAMGLSLLAPERFTWGLTSIHVPQGVDGAKLLAAMASEFGVVMAGGQGHMKNSVVRLGHMGYVDYGDVLAGLAALGQCLEAMGFKAASPGYLSRAMAAHVQGLAERGPEALL